MRARMSDRQSPPARLARLCKICGFPYFVDEDELVGGVCRGCREGQRGMSCREIHERRKVIIKGEIK